MNGQEIGLFIHIVGGLGFFVALGLEWTGLRQIRSAITPEQVREWMGILGSARKVGIISMLAIVLTGVFSMIVEWGYKAWIIVPLGAFVLVIALAQGLTRPRMMAIGRALAAEKGALPKNFHSLANHPLLWISIQTRVAISLGIVLLMIAEPGWVWSLLTIGVAIVLGVVSALPFPRRERVQESSAD